MDTKFFVDLVFEVARNEGIVEPMQFSNTNHGPKVLAVLGRRRDCQQLVAHVISEMRFAENMDDFSDRVEVLLSYTTRPAGGNEVVMYWPLLTV